jgi:hypothetical protein
LEEFKLMRKKYLIYWFTVEELAGYWTVK